MSLRDLMDKAIEKLHQGRSDQGWDASPFDPEREAQQEAVDEATGRSDERTAGSQPDPSMGDPL